MNKEETVQEYYLRMKELASRDKIEEEALIQYVIDGIQDNTNNKIVLYGARRLEDFKEKLKVYENIRKKNQDKMKSYREKDDSAKKEESWKKPKKIENKKQELETRL